MQVSKDFLNVGLVFLSSDFKVVGMNEFANLSKISLQKLRNKLISLKRR